MNGLNMLKPPLKSPEVNLLFDAHTHLQDPRLDGLREDFIRDAAQMGMAGVCCCGTGPGDWEALTRLCHQPQPLELRPAFGVHPWQVASLPADWLELLKRALDLTPGALLGEIGLDGLRGAMTFEAQLPVLTAQLDLAVERQMPVILHGARAWGRLVAVLARYAEGLPGFVVHSFSGSCEVMQQLLGMGGLISFSGAICDHKAVRLRKLVREVPDSRLLVETDTPDMFPRDAQAIRVTAHEELLNQPANLICVLRTAAALRSTTVESLATLTMSNARRIFGADANTR